MDINLVTFKMVTSYNHFIILFLILMQVHWCFSLHRVLICDVLSHKESCDAVNMHLAPQHLFFTCIWIVFYVKQAN